MVGPENFYAPYSSINLANLYLKRWFSETFSHICIISLLNFQLCLHNDKLILITELSMIKSIKITETFINHIYIMFKLIRKLPLFRKWLTYGKQEELHWTVPKRLDTCCHRDLDFGYCWGGSSQCWATGCSGGDDCTLTSDWAATALTPRWWGVMPIQSLHWRTCVGTCVQWQGAGGEVIFRDLAGAGFEYTNT